MKVGRILESVDWVLLGAAALLVCIGLAMLASGTDAGKSGLSSLLIRQMVALVVGGVAMSVAIKVPYHAWRRIVMVIFGATLVGEGILLFVGRTIRGTVSRLDIMGFQIQPSEFLKIALVLLLAWILSRHRRVWHNIFFTALATGIPVVLLMQEPDLGMAMLIILCWAGMLMVYGIPWKSIGILLLVGIAIATYGWHNVLLTYQKQRILTFLNPTANSLSSGYNVTQSIIAFGSGQVLGRGLGHGPQSQLKFLPERHTDFIFASVGEELGFVGIMLVILLYSILLWRIVGIIRQTSDPFGQLICVGAFFLLLVGFLVNAGMNMGVLPVTGIPLPLISYGGSNLLATCFIIGLVESVKVHSTFSQPGPKELTSFI